jgi:hypothetical protein
MPFVLETVVMIKIESHPNQVQNNMVLFSYEIDELVKCDLVTF